MSAIKILAFAGSTRTDSYNKKLVKIAAEGARAEGAEVTLIDLRDFPMPLFDGDLEAASGLPEHAKRLKRLMIGHHGLLISTPEYNSSITGVLKNAIDWASREETDDEPPLVCFRGKTAALVSASPGRIRGVAEPAARAGDPGASRRTCCRTRWRYRGRTRRLTKRARSRMPGRQNAVMDVGAKLAEFTRKLVA